MVHKPGSSCYTTMSSELFRLLPLLYIMAETAAAVESGDFDACVGQVCKFQLIIERGETMSTVIDGVTFHVAVENSTGRLRVAENSFRAARHFPEVISRYVDKRNVITADGVKRDVFTVNKRFPGPTIEVFEGSQVEVTVLNRLKTETTSIHWHGLYMRDNYYMDGVPYVTQCPILPGQSFTYRFVAEPAGTHWYHSHLYNQRMDGLYGMLIVHRRDRPTAPPRSLPLLVTDWQHASHSTILSRHGYSHMDASHLRPVTGVIAGGCMVTTKEYSSGEFLTEFPRREYSLDGIELGAATYVSSLINGRGRYPEDDLSLRLPLTEYQLDSDGGCDADAAGDQSGARCRFRLVNAASDFSYEVSVDDHSVQLLALDGHDIVPTTVDSFVAHPGERFDFEIVPEASSAQLHGPRLSMRKYWLRAVTLGHHIGLDPNASSSPVHEAWAVIVYVTNSTADDVASDIGDPVTSSSRRPCLADRRCLVFNCPFGDHFPSSLYKSCVSLADVRHVMSAGHRHPNHGLDDVAVSHEFFVNFGYGVGSSVNAVRFVWPTGLISASKSLPPERYSVKCVDEETTCRQKGCACTNVKPLPYNVTVQMVLINYQGDQTLPSHHSIHFHGHSFAVVAVGFAPQNETTGRLTGSNTAVSCDTDLCAAASWSASHESGSRPRLNLIDPVVKDTVLVPAKGYVVIRFRTDNPGLWLMHCHQEMHAIEGMTIAWNEAPERHRVPPVNFPTCDGDAYEVHSAAASVEWHPLCWVLMVVASAIVRLVIV